MHYRYAPQGVCSRMIDFDIEDGKVRNLSFYGGCAGNLLAISKLLEGVEMQEVIDKLKGNPCGFRPTSCTDQLARALEAVIDGSLQPAE